MPKQLRCCFFLAASFPTATSQQLFQSSPSMMMVVVVISMTQPTFFLPPFYVSPTNLTNLPSISQPTLI
ncbi:hypothetical protein OWV82_025147 [Melia azedarach]|uniref:Uncharacterized protein n=1 Tax=Melia azedarach TaxID=155640 RepID=A0ACC1WSY6_MELAZ|nr:hypothetical protein OWV82_025147 [Melia azedarach]